MNNTCAGVGHLCDEYYNSGRDRVNKIIIAFMASFIGVHHGLLNAICRVWSIQYSVTVVPHGRDYGCNHDQSLVTIEDVCNQVFSVVQTIVR